jgi:flagellar FliJ protein
MKTYHFKLQAVLKLRKIKEEKCRTELGFLIAKLEKIKKQITYDSEQIQKYFDHQEYNLNSGMTASKVQLFPFLVEGKQRNISLLRDALEKQNELIERKKKELSKFKADLKVIEKLREKDFDQYKKELNKEIDQKIEEQSQLWLSAIKEEEI